MTAFAQLEVKEGSFHKVDGFVNINLDKMTDDNEQPYAVLKIKTENLGSKERRELNFGGDARTFFEVEYKDGEVWLYISYYASYIKISHEELSSTEFYFPFDMEPKCGYELTLVNKANTVISGWAALTVTTKPENGAKVLLNGRDVNAITPYSNNMMPPGKYEITVTKDHYKTITETITIDDGENKNIEIVMPIDVATITLTADAQTSVYVDGEYKKSGTWAGELYSGQHEIVYKKQYHNDATQTITVEAGTPASYSLNLNPIYGKMNITSEPTGATVYIDGNEYGVTPMETNSLIIGPHELKIEKERWRTLKKQVVLEEGKVLTLNESLENCPNGAINALFSVSPTEKVYFSQGNLQYQASTKTWRFAEHQWDIIGSENSKISENYSGWIDLFGCGTGNNPTNSSKSNSDYSSFTDWGKNTISNGSGKSWFTLTKDEWVYVFDTRSTSSGIRYAKATVNGVNGVILLPDTWNSSNYSLSKTNKSDASFRSNRISQSDWTSKLEANGAVFLPAAGWRYGTSVDDVGSYGGYWSATYISSDFAYYVGFYDGLLRADSWGGREYGRSVRLVCSAEN